MSSLFILGGKSMYGNIFITNNMEALANAANSGLTIIALVDDADKFKYTGCLTAGVLLPNTDTVSLEIEEKYELAEQSYIAWLMNPICQSMLAIIIAALRKGKDLMLFIPEDGSLNFRLTYIFMAFMYNKFGIVVADGICLDSRFSSTPNTNMDPTFESIRINSMFQYDTIDFDTYAMLYPPNIWPSQECSAIVYSNNHYGQFADPQTMIQYTYSLICTVKNQQSPNMINPIIRLKKEL